MTSRVRLSTRKKSLKQKPPCFGLPLLVLFANIKEGLARIMFNPHLAFAC